MLVGQPLRRRGEDSALNERGRLLLQRPVASVSSRGRVPLLLERVTFFISEESHQRRRLETTFLRTSLHAHPVCFPASCHAIPDTPSFIARNRIPFSPVFAVADAALGPVAGRRSSNGNRRNISSTEQSAVDERAQKKRQFPLRAMTVHFPQSRGREVDITQPQRAREFQKP